MYKTTSDNCFNRPCLSELVNHQRVVPCTLEIADLILSVLFTCLLIWHEVFAEF